MNEELLYNEVYEQTIDFGRTQFIKEIMRLIKENQQLNELIKKAKQYMYENSLDIVYEENGEARCYWDMIKVDDVEAILEGNDVSE